MINKFCLMVGAPTALIISAIAYYQDNSGLYHLHKWLAPVVFLAGFGGFCLISFLYQKVFNKS